MEELRELQAKLGPDKSQLNADTENEEDSISNELTDDYLSDPDYSPTSLTGAQDASSSEVRPRSSSTTLTDSSQLMSPSPDFPEDQGKSNATWPNSSASPSTSESKNGKRKVPHEESLAKIFPNLSDNGKSIKTGLTTTPGRKNFVEHHSLSIDEIPDALYYVDYALAAENSLYQTVLYPGTDQPSAIPRPPPNIDDLIVFHMDGQSRRPCDKTRRKLPPTSLGSGFVSLYADKGLLRQKLDRLQGESPQTLPDNQKFAIHKLVKSRLLRYEPPMYHVPRVIGSGIKWDLIVFDLKDLVEKGLLEEDEKWWLPAEGQYLLWGMVEVKLS